MSYNTESFIEIRELSPLKSLQELGLVHKQLKLDPRRTQNAIHTDTVNRVPNLIDKVFTALQADEIAVFPSDLEQIADIIKVLPPYDLTTVQILDRGLKASKNIISKRDGDDDKISKFTQTVSDYMVHISPDKLEGLHVFQSEA